VPRGMTTDSWLKRTASSKNRVIVNMDAFEIEAVTLLAARAGKHPAELIRSWIRTKAKRLPIYNNGIKEIA
jgi:hypothetical protein